MPTAVEDVLELSLLACKILAYMEVDAVDRLPYKDHSLENDPPQHRKPMEAAQDWNNVARRRAPDTKRAAVFRTDGSRQ